MHPRAPDGIGQTISYGEYPSELDELKQLSALYNSGEPAKIDFVSVDIAIISGAGKSFCAGADLNT
jgi:hypothetical protein